MKDARTIRDWPARERPRERLLARGPGALSEAELLALIVKAGPRGGGGAVDSCRRLLLHVGGLAGLPTCGAAELMQHPGVGPARACAMVAAIELGRRAHEVRVDRGGALTSSERVYQRIRGRLAGLRQEVFLVLALDGRNQTFGVHQVAQGSATSVEVQPREVFRPLIREGAAAGIVAHNHPSGDAEPSDDDLLLTERLRGAADLIGIPLLDHLVVGDGRYVSFADRGLL